MAKVESREGRVLGLAPRMPFHPPMNAQEKIHEAQRRQGGFTLVELLVGMMLTLAVLMLALPVIDGAFRTEGRVETAALSVGDARAFSERVGRDLRLTDKVYSADQNSLSVETYVHRTACGSDIPSAETDPPIQCTVTYSCSGGTCTRQEGTAAPVTLVTGLSDDNVFSYPCPPNPLSSSACPATPNPDDVGYVGLTAVLPNQSDIGGDAITLNDGTALRNVR
jgi:type II secretory pathway pseudopilin PulG